VITVSPTRAKIVIVLFAVAMVYGSVCSAMCVAGFCPNLERHAGHDCDESSHHHPHGHGQHGPDCTQHAHPPDFAVKTSGIAPFQDHAATLLAAAAVLEAFSTPLAINQDVLRLSHRRPLDISNDNLSQRAAVLRI